MRMAVRRQQGADSYRTRTVPPSSFVQKPLTTDTEVGREEFLSGPLTEKTHITGPTELRLFAKIDQENTNWIVALYKQIAGELSHLTTGYLKASHRQIDSERSAKGCPRHIHDQAQSVTPGEVLEYRIGFPPISTEFTEGSRLLVEIRSVEIPFREERLSSHGGLHHHLPQSVTTTHHIYHDADRRSRLIMPQLNRPE